MTTNIIKGDFTNNTLTGPDGADMVNFIYGDTDGQMMGGLTGGDDTLIGGADATNTLVGDANTMVANTTGGNDTLIGGVGGTNYLIGDALNTHGEAPTGGNDRLVSADSTTDNMWGDFQDAIGGPPTGGHDTFVFTPQNGNDTIYDFQPGVDTIELDGFFKGHGAGHIPALPPQAAGDIPPQAGGGVMESFKDLNITTDGNNSVIHFDANDTVTVVGVTGLTAADFHFVA